MYCVYLYVTAIIFLTLLSIINRIKFGKEIGISFPRVPNVEQDVIDEERRVNQNSCNDPIKFNHIQKLYKSTVALKDLSFGIKKGECFGLLGVNGAGKTTLLKILTQAVDMTSGNGTIENHQLTENIMNYIRFCGYCPQADIIIPQLNVKQHLYFYCYLKGISTSIINSYVEEIINVFSLKEYEKQEAEKLSGGNKRKLCAAISLIGNPSILILDEPSTGIDPESRRYLWNLIDYLCKKQQSSTVLLTTHALEEAEALCDRISIIVKGELKCIGSIQHIKSKYGQFYKIEVLYLFLID